jgi:hypothetical protein
MARLDLAEVFPQTCASAEMKEAANCGGLFVLNNFTF